ncbi:MAG: integrin alpha, partial [Candidatus Thermoplasmatota archaeon]
MKERLLILFVCIMLSICLSMPIEKCSSNEKNPSKIITFYGYGYNNTYKLKVASESHALSGYIKIKGLPYSEDSLQYPLNPDLDIGDDKSREWEFRGVGYGAFGYQYLFNDSSAKKEIDVNGPTTSTVSIRIPKGATVLNASIEITGISIGNTLYGIDIVNGEKTHGSFAYSVSSAGDVNGDGYDDIVVGAPNWDYTRQYGYTGRAYIY